MITAMESNYLDLSPNPRSHIRTLTRIGYNFNSAVSDIIDNSIAAKSNHIWIKATHYGSKVKISIIDDGFGMGRNELVQNMRIGCKDPSDERSEEDLGRFGSGLKTASFSQAEVLKVCSKVEGKDWSGACWDIEEIRKSNSWRLKLLDSRELKEIVTESSIDNVSGTIVIWEKLHKYVEADDPSPVDIEDALADDIFWLKKYIGIHFHKFLSGKARIKIFVNDDELEAISPFLESEPGYWEGPQQSFRMRNRKGKVEIKVHNIPHSTKLSRAASERMEILKSLTNGQGFYVYRNSRLIIPGGWLGLSRNSQLGRLARVEVNIPSSLDEDWTTDVKKSSIEIPHQVKSRLKAVIDMPVKQSKRAYTYRGVSEVANDYWEIVENKSSGETSYHISSNNDDLIKLSSELSYAQRLMLLTYLKGLASNLPCHNIYYVMAEEKKRIKQDSDELDRVLKEILFNG